MLFGLNVTPRARLLWSIACLYVATGWALFVSSGHSVFAAFFGPFAVAATASVVFFGIASVAALIRAIKRLF